MQLAAGFKKARKVLFLHAYLKTNLTLPPFAMGSLGMQASDASEDIRSTLLSSLLVANLISGLRHVVIAWWTRIATCVSWARPTSPWTHGIFDAPSPFPTAVRR